MPPESSRGKRRPNDDDDALSIRKKGAGSNTLLLWLALGGIGVLLIACLLGIGIAVAVALFNDATAAKLPGSWKGRFVFPGQVIDANYVFKQDGSFRQETLNPRGQIVDVVDGRWHVEFGEIVIDWNNGAFERATVE